MPADQLIASLARTRPVTYTIAGDVSDDCRDAFVLKHWTEPVEILVVRPRSASYITFSKYVNNELTVRITTTVAILRDRLIVPDAVLVWSRLNLFNSRAPGAEPTHLIVRDEKVFVQPNRGGSDARARNGSRSRGSDAREDARAHARERAHAPAPAHPREHAPARARTHTRTRPRRAGALLDAYAPALRPVLDRLADVLRLRARRP